MATSIWDYSEPCFACYEMIGSGEIRFYTPAGKRLCGECNHKLQDEEDVCRWCGYKGFRNPPPTYRDKFFDDGMCLTCHWVGERAAEKARTVALENRRMAAARGELGDND